MAEFKQKVTLELVDKFTTAAKGVDNSLKALLGGFKGLAGAAGVAGLGVVLGKSVQAFAEAEKSTKQLEFALKAAGITSRNTLDDYNAFSAQIQKTTEFTEEQAQSVLRLYTQYGIFGEEAKEATKLAADLASAMGTDIQTAALNLAKASEGNVQGLQKLGIKLKDTGGEGRKFADILGAVNAKFGGFSEAISGTTAGNLDQLKKNFGEIAEKIGSIVASLDKKFNVTGGINTLLDKLVGSEGPKNLENLKKINNELLLMQEALTNPTLGISESFAQNRIQELKKALLAERKLIEEENKKASDEINKKGGKKILGVDPKDLENAQKDYRKYIQGLEIAHATGAKKIRLEEAKKHAEIEELSKKAGKKHEEIEREKAEVTKQANKDILQNTREQASETLGQYTALMSGISANVQNTFQNLTTTIGNSILPGLGSAFQATYNTISSIADAFTTKYISEFDKLSQAASKLLGRLNEIKRGLEDQREVERARESGELVELGSVVEGARAANDLLREFGIDPGLGSGVLQNLLRARETESGQFRLFYRRDPETNDLVFGYKKGDRFFDFAVQRGDTGDLQITSRVAGSEADTRRLIAGLQDRGFLPRRRFGGLIPIGAGNRDNVPAMLDGGEFIVRREAVNASTIRQLQRINATGRGGSEGGSYTFHIQAIDSQGVEEFLKMRLAPLMKKMSGRNGLVFVNDRGVSNNA